DRDWTLEAYGAFAEELSEGGTNNQINSTFLAEALGNAVDNPATSYSAARDGYFNPFGSGGADGDAVLDFISQGYTWSRYRSRISSANLMLDGSPLSLPGGDLRIAVGASFRREAFNRRSQNFASGVAPVITIGDPQFRDIGAVFMEVRAPLVGEANAMPGIKRLELTLAGRAEDYDDVGATSNPKVGLIWQPSDPFTVRASWGTSFRAPALTEVFDRVQLGPLTVSDSGVSRVAILQSGGNTDLEPETAESLTVGVEWALRPGMRFSVGYFDIRFENKIGRPALENITSILVDPSLSPFVTRLTPGNAADLARVQAFLADPRFVSPTLYPASSYSVILDGRWANTGELNVEGIDLAGSYDFDIGDNTFGLSLSASYLLDYSRRVTPVAVREDVLGLVGFPVDLRAQAAATWTRGDWSTRIGVNHASDYHDAAGRTIDAFTTADLQLRWAGGGTGLAEGVEAALTIQNIFDADPPFYDSPQGFGFDPGQAGPLGRVAAFQLIKRW
ncbi:TonB-dependent receptor, partial [uncultured Brevundimonas sp.]|uniref:TonB-dependent receptor domain-containing protein n=1 Tax=uncultured Brevundimonas sp. TaxID=213418 RepID=UPI0025CD731F